MNGRPSNQYKIPKDPSIFSVISNFVADRDELNSDIIRCLEKASNDPEFDAVSFMTKKVMELSVVEKNIETTQNLYNRFSLKSMAQELTSELNKTEETNNNKDDDHTT